MSAVQELLTLSEEFYHEVYKQSSKNEREKVINKIKDFLSKRECLLSSLTRPFSAEDKDLGQQILDYDQKIQSKLNAIKQEIREDILTVKKQKTNTPKFINPYASTIVNGVFFDKRK